jgi:hypothetical protein
MGQKRSTEEIARLLEGYEASGLTRTEYCRREGVAATALDYYRRRKARKEKGRLAKVVVKTEPAGPHQHHQLRRSVAAHHQLAVIFVELQRGAGGDFGFWAEWRHPKRPIRREQPAAHYDSADRRHYIHV